MRLKPSGSSEPQESDDVPFGEGVESAGGSGDVQKWPERRGIWSQSGKVEVVQLDQSQLLKLIEAGR